MKLYICENFKNAKWGKNITNDKKLSLVFAKKCICDFIEEKERNIEIVFSKNEYGKPYAQDIYKISAKTKEEPEPEKTKIDISVYFSISHSEDMMVCAVACFNIGVDCQKRIADHIERYKKIAGRFFSEKENMMLDSILSLSADHSDNDDETETEMKEQKYINDFFKIWTKKEAYIKYTGKGLAEGMQTFSVTTAAKQKSYCGDVYFKRIYLSKVKKTNKSESNKFYIYLCYNKENKNIWRIKFFN